MPQHTGIRVPTLVLNTAIPVPPPDSRVSPTGALVYVDPTHPANPMPAGVGTVPNLVGYIASKVMGTTNIDHTAIGVRNTFGVGEGVAEKSGKGGIYVASSRTISALDHVYQLLLSAQMKAWILANKEHMFYFSSSMRILRGGLTGQNTHLIRVGQNGSAYAIAAQEGAESRSTSLSGVPTPNRTTGVAPGLVRVSAAGRGKDAARGVDITALVDWFFTAGPLTAAGVNKAADVILYDFYFEDLTLSGNNYADVDAKWAEKHALMHGAGGRYAGDTWRDPATIA